MKTIQEMARQVGYPIQHEEWRKATEEFAAMVRADERSSWPAEMEAMERQVNILTDALAQEREPWWRKATKSEVSVESSVQCAAAIRARGTT